MSSRLAVCAIALCLLALSGCGRVETNVVTRPDNIATFKQVRLVQPQVTSQEQGSEYAEMNARWQKLAYDQLQSMLAQKGISVTGDAQATVECHIDVVYGSRALRFWVGGGAGTGHFAATIQLRDGGGVVRYATRSDADLAVGVTGGDMEKVAQNAVDEAVQGFGAGL